MSYCNPKTFGPAFAGLTIVAFFSPICIYGQGAEVLRLRTDGLPTPLVITGDPLERPVTSVEIRGEIDPDGSGTGQISLDVSQFTFNEFGDATKAESKAPEPSKVTFTRVKPPQKDVFGRPNPTGTNEKRRSYEIAFDDGSFPKVMKLVLSDGATGPHRLLIYGRKEPLPGERPAPIRILNLQGEPEIKEPLPARPVRSPFNLTTLISSEGRAGLELKRLSIRGALNGPADLTLDPNHLGFNLFGNVTSSTLMGYTPIPVTLKRVEIADPAGKDRLLFQVVPIGKTLTARYSLVLSPTDAGPHRLLVRDKDKLQYVLPMYDPERRYQLIVQLQLEQTSPEEQRAIADLRQMIGGQFRLKVESQSVVELSLQSGDDADLFNPILQHLKNLRRLAFGGSALNDVGLSSLHVLNKLESLSFSGGQFDDRGLASLEDLPQLQGLTFRHCRGITDQGMAHLAGLKNLRFLQIYGEDSRLKPDPKEKLVTDAGLENLRGLTKLEYLDLMGQKITDAGLEQLKGLTSLQRLYLSGDGITDAGLDHLKGLSNLKYLHLYETRVTAQGEAALKSELPQLNIGN